MKGWVRLYRDLQEWEWYTKSEMVHLYIHLLLSANHTPAKWQGVTIKCGQVVTSVAQLAQKTGLSVQTTRTCLARLKSTNEITIETTKQYTLITICNYSRYIDKASTNNKQSNRTDNHKICRIQCHFYIFIKSAVIHTYLLARYFLISTAHAARIIAPLMI